MRSAALCMGIGGLDLAVEAFFGCELAWCAEFADAPSQIIERHWPGVPNHRDITTLDWSSCEPVDILTAGYRCIVMEVGDPNTWPALLTWADTVEAAGYGPLAADTRAMVEAAAIGSSNAEGGPRG